MQIVDTLVKSPSSPAPAHAPKYVLHCTIRTVSSPEVAAASAALQHGPFFPSFSAKPKVALTALTSS